MNQRVRRVTKDQLKEGFTIRWPSGLTYQANYVVLQANGDGTFLVKEPFVCIDDFVFDAAELN